MNKPKYAGLMILLIMSAILWVSAAAAQDAGSGITAPEFVRTSQTFEPVGAYELFLEDLDADEAERCRKTGRTLMRDGQITAAGARAIAERGWLTPAQGCP